MWKMFYLCVNSIGKDVLFMILVCVCLAFLRTSLKLF